jgi:hypothetical protein
MILSNVAATSAAAAKNSLTAPIEMRLTASVGGMAPNSLVNMSTSLMSPSNLMSSASATLPSYPSNAGLATSTSSNVSSSSSQLAHAKFDRLTLGDTHRRYAPVFKDYSDIPGAPKLPTLDPNPAPNICPFLHLSEEDREQESKHERSRRQKIALFMQYDQKLQEIQRTAAAKLLSQNGQSLESLPDEQHSRPCDLPPTPMASSHHKDDALSSVLKVQSPPESPAVTPGVASHGNSTPISSSAGHTPAVSSSISSASTSGASLLKEANSLIVADSNLVKYMDKKKREVHKEVRISHWGRRSLFFKCD